MNKVVYESTAPGEALRFAKYYRRKGLEVFVILFGPGVFLAKRGKNGLPPYDKIAPDCLDLGVKLHCCGPACKLVGLGEKELIDGIGLVSSQDVAQLVLEYRQKGQLIISL